jgi:hypothetical protein
VEAKGKSSKRKTPELDHVPHSLTTRKLCLKRWKRKRKEEKKKLPIISLSWAI